MAVDKKNIFLSNTVEPIPFTSRSRRGPTARIPERDVKTYALILKGKFEQAYKQNLIQKQVAAIRYKDGTYLNITGQKEHDLQFKSLENMSVGIRLLNVRTDEDSDQTEATIYIPEGKHRYFLDRLEKYSQSFEETGKARHQKLLNSIEDVKLAFLDSFWIGDKEDIPRENRVWCEVWLRADTNQYDTPHKAFEESCTELQIENKNQAIFFLERIVKIIHASANEIEQLISSNDYIAEIRKAPEAVGFFDELSPKKQLEWVDDLLSRTTFESKDVSICILDTGVTTGHPLIDQAVPDNAVHTVEASWNTNDHSGHGTEMAGIALYFDLKEGLLSTKSFEVNHYLESVKILPPKGENDPDLYGDITQRAVSLAEIGNPHLNRVICMAITAPDKATSDGTPSSWSGEIDNITSGAQRGNERHLFFISAGNVEPNEIKEGGYPDANLLHTVESPGQAWNAITVGAYSKDIQINDTFFKDYSAVADVGGLSPFSSTSRTWKKAWPIKPDVLFDGGNMASNDIDYSECTDLSLLTTYYRPLVRSFSTINATSAATAQAAWMAAQIMSEYPGIWPETVRALIVHSARWTEQMKRMFCLVDKKTLGRNMLLRTCGYGIPDLGRAIQCMNNNVNMVIEAELQPYKDDKMNEMHIHRIPWPKEELRQLGEQEAVMRVTLSYFIEPGPGEIGWKNKYRYPSCGLRFDVNNSNENKDDFEKRINVKMREDKSDKGEGDSGSEYWYLGADNRDVGSIHSDSRPQRAVDLCEAEYIAVYPVVGWWRERAYLGKSNSKIRYSLIVSISTPEVDIDLYTPIVNQVEIATKQAIEIEI